MEVSAISFSTLEKLFPEVDGITRLKHPLALILFEPDRGSQISSAFIHDRERGAIKIPIGQVPITPFTVNFVIIKRNGQHWGRTRVYEVVSKGLQMVHQGPAGWD